MENYIKEFLDYLKYIKFLNDESVITFISVYNAVITGINQKIKNPPEQKLYDDKSLNNIFTNPTPSEYEIIIRTIFDYISSLSPNQLKVLAKGIIDGYNENKNKIKYKFTFRLIEIYENNSIKYYLKKWINTLKKEKDNEILNVNIENNNNYNNNNNSNNEKDNENKIRVKEINRKNVSFNSNILNKNTNNIEYNKTDTRLNSDNCLNVDRIKKGKMELDILETSPVLTVEEKMRNINDTYSNNIPSIENEKNDNKNNDKVSEISFSDSNKSNSISFDSENQKKIIFPSRTSQIGINFITKEKEEEIYNDKSNETKKICELIYILLEEEHQFEENKDIKTLFKYLFNTYNVDNIKDLFFKVIYPKIYLTNSIDNGIYSIYNKAMIDNLKEFKLICKATNQPLSWLGINILEIFKYFKLIFDK